MAYQEEMLAYVHSDDEEEEEEEEERGGGECFIGNYTVIVEAWQKQPRVRA